MLHSVNKKGNRPKWSQKRLAVSVRRGQGFTEVRVLGDQSLEKFARGPRDAVVRRGGRRRRQRLGDLESIVLLDHTGHESLVLWHAVAVIFGGVGHVDLTVE